MIQSFRNGKYLNCPTEWKDDNMNDLVINKGPETSLEPK